MMNWSPQISQPIERHRAPVENTVLSACPTVHPAVVQLAQAAITWIRTLMARPVRVVVATAPRGPPLHTNTPSSAAAANGSGFLMETV